MREEDRKAFVEEYLELCRKYGLYIDSEDQMTELMIIRQHELKEYVQDFENYMERLV